MNNNRPLRVFLCHASQDKSAVRELNERLKSEDWLDPWLDEEKISLGQHWTTVIEDALDAADIVIVFLSNNSVRKESFVQRELNYALKISLEKPHDVIFLIPLRLEDCVVPRFLRDKQWGDYFGDNRENSYNSLLRSLKERHDYLLRIEAEKHTNHDKQIEEQILQITGIELPEESIVNSGKEKKINLPDFRVRQRDYLLEMSRALTQELDLEKLLSRVLRISIEMLAGQAGLILLKEQEGWRVNAAHGIAPAFLNYLSPLLKEEKVRELDLDELNRLLKNLTYTASKGLLNGVGLPLSAKEQLIGDVFIFRNYPDLFSANDRRLLEAFSDQTAIAIKNAQLYQEAITKPFATRRHY